MKKTIVASEEYRRNLKKRLFATLSMLMVVVILSVMVSYAWIVLSNAPEVKGIMTTIGANGSLEIALLNDETFSDPNLVTTSANVSLSQNVVSANECWGNLVDLNDPSYGLRDVVLYPSRLNISVNPAGDGYRVDRNGSMLLVPTYGSDGRITQLTDKTVTGTYNENAFYHYAKPDYGVRAIGTATSLSVQSSALSLAKNNINSYTVGARNAAIASVDGVQDLLLKFAGGGSDNTAFVREDLDLLETMIERLQTAENYVEAALRQGMVAIAASTITELAEFETIRSVILSSTPISALIGSVSLPSSAFNFRLWVDKQEQMAANLQLAEVKLLTLYKELDDGNTVVKSDVQEILNYLMNLNQVLVNDQAFTEITREDLMGMLGTEVNLVLRPGSGVYADIADFAGNYSASVGNLAQIKTYSAISPVYLVDLLNNVKTLIAADGGSVAEQIEMQDLYGYALDLAFRCNAPRSDLLLQTSGIHRVYDASASDASMGGGSYMEFTVSGGVDADQLTALMNAVRVAFVGDDGTLLGVAKLNISNRVLNSETGNVMAPLYLYEFELASTGANAGQLVMGSRRKSNDVITSMERNHAMAISTFVWLDGDTVDNSVIPISGNVSGLLNLQFSSSADLLPAENNSLSGYEVDREGLAMMVEDVYTNYVYYGRSHYTTVSWTNLMNAYNRAESVSNDPIATENLIYNTQLALESAVDNLQKLEGDFLDLAIDSIREFMGSTTDHARLLYKQDANGNPVLITTYTQQQYDQSTKRWIESVDNNKNLRHEGNDVYTPIYTEESWNNLADALYYVEALRNYCSPTPEQKDSAYTRLQLAYDALDFCVYFTPYDYEGMRFYKASSDDADTYGTWYYDDMTRVLSETTILKLDAYAVETVFAELELEEYTPHWYGCVYPHIQLSHGLYNQEIIGVHWEVPDGWVHEYSGEQNSSFSSLYETALAIEADIPQSALDILDRRESTDGTINYGIKSGTPYDAAATAIADLETVIEQKQVVNPYPITEIQHVLLNKAILNAQSVDGYHDESVVTSKMVTLRNAINAADKLLLNPDATSSNAAAALTNLNNAIRSFDSTLVVSEYNTIEYSIPKAMGDFDLKYRLDDDWMNPRFLSDADHGTYPFSAVLVNSAGIVCRVETSTVIYNKADGVQIGSDKNCTVGDTFLLSPQLMEDDRYPTDENILHDETEILIEDLSVVELTEDGRLVAKAAGKTKVYVYVYTNYGNRYIDSIEVMVEAKKP